MNDRHLQLPVFTSLWDVKQAALVVTFGETFIILPQVKLDDSGF